MSVMNRIIFLIFIISPFHFLMAKEFHQLDQCEEGRDYWNPWPELENVQSIPYKKSCKVSFDKMSVGNISIAIPVESYLKFNMTGWCGSYSRPLLGIVHLWVDFNNHSIPIYNYTTKVFLKKESFHPTLHHDGIISFKNNFIQQIEALTTRSVQI